jgi:cytochrome c-type biogenesis protein CcmF
VSATVLIVDDSLTVRMDLVEALEAAGFRCVPCASAADARRALIEGRVDTAWARWVRPWTLGAWCALTLGVARGSWWAYYELGWGGGWFWDPVENASLVPWFVAAALLHGLLIQRTTGALVRTNLLLALLAWGTVLGGTYLTRSGVLQDFSVHSFTDAGLNAPLSAFLLGSVLLGAGLLLARWGSVPATPPWCRA